MPSEPPPTTWTLARPPADHPHDVWAIGADLEPGTLLAAYRLGLFPMPVEDDLVWWSPEERAVIPVTGFRASRSLRRAARGYEIRVDTAFGEVIRGCADPRRPHGWIDEDFVAAYTRLHELGWAHSVEAWDDEGLAGGLYGVGIGGLFAAESKFYRRTGASKAALLGLDRAAPARPVASGCSTCSGRRRICSRSGRSRCRGRSTTGCWTRRSLLPDALG